MRLVKSPVDNQDVEKSYIGEPICKSLERK
jgi:hypothetical protein